MKDLDRVLIRGIETLSENGHSCAVTQSEFVRWFQTDTPYPDISMEEVLLNPLLVIHELVEIDEVKRLGLSLTKDVIVSNLELVDREHFKAAKVEMKVAIATGNRAHIVDRLKDIRAWSKDELTTAEMRGNYSRLAEEVEKALAELDDKE